MRFEDRADAGRHLSNELQRFAGERPIVVALPRGGVPVGYEIARALDAPLDVLIARKLGAPGHPELGIGAIAQGGASYLNREVISMLGVSRDHIEQVSRLELAEIDRRVRAYRGDRPPLDVRGRTAILVDDGLATGATTRAAIRALRALGPRAIVIAFPVCARETAIAIQREVDEIVCAMVPRDFHAVGLWYSDFTQTTDEEVIELLARRERELAKEKPLSGRSPEPG